MATYSWASGVSADWSVGADWSPSGVPNAATSDVTISVDGLYTVGIAAAGSYKVDSLTLASDLGGLQVDGTLALAGTLATLTLSSGFLDLGGSGGATGGAGTITGGSLVLNGGSLEVLGAGKITGAATLDGSVVAIAAGKSLTLTGSNSFGNSHIEGPGTLATSGTTTVTSTMYLDGSLTWVNTGTVLNGSQFYVGYPSQTGTFVIQNKAGAAFEMTADGVAFNNYVTPSFVNAGTLAKTGGTGTSSIGAFVTGSGTITASTGTLELDAGGVLAGTIGATGTGALAFGVGAFTLAGTAQTITGAAVLDGGTLSIGAGKTLTFSGADTWTSGQINGPGTLATTGTTAVTSTMYLDGSLTWVNTGTVLEGASIYLGYPSQTGTITIQNVAGAVYDVTADGQALYQYGSAVVTFANAGTVAKTAGTGTSNIRAFVTGSGTITASTGTLELDAGGVLAGTIGATGTGALAFGVGAFTLAGTAQTITGAAVLDGGTLAIDAGKTLIFSGADTWTGGYIVGPGTLATSGTTTVTGAIYLDGSLTWVNSGKVLASSYLYGGYPSGTGTITIQNVAGAVYDLTADGQALYQYGSAVVTFANAGTVAKTAGTGTSNFQGFFTNTGTVNVAAGGTLEFDGGGSFSGTVGGPGTIGFAGSGTNTIAAGTSLNAGALSFTGGDTEFTGSRTLGSAVALNGGAITIDAGKTLTLSGANTWNGGYIDGPGTLATSGTTTVTSTTYLDGSLTWVNSGTVLEGASIYLGYPSGTGTITVQNVAGAVYDLTADGQALYQYGSAVVTFANAGTLAKIAGTGTSSLQFSVTDTGTLMATSGVLELDAASTLDGAIGGSLFGVVALGVGYAFTTSAGASASVLDDQTATSLVLDAGAVWTDSGTIGVGGKVSLGSDTSTAATLAIAAGGELDFTGNDGTLVSGGLYQITNAGRIAKTGGSAVTSLALAVANAGTIDAASGTFKISGKLGSNGQVRIEAGDTAEISNSSIVGSNTVDFAGPGATLKLDGAFALTKSIIGLGAGSRIDLAKTASATAAIVNGNTLTITPGGGTALKYVSTTPLTGLDVEVASDGSAGTMVALFRQATAVFTPEPMTFGARHVGDIVSQAITLTNAATADGYSENLDASLASSATGVGVSGTVTGLAAGATDSTDLAVTLNTANDGTIAGTVALLLATDGTGIDGFGATSLVSQTVNVSGAVYAYASPGLTGATLNLGAARVGDEALSGQATLTNGTAFDTYQENLVYAVGGAPALSVSNGAGTLVSGGSVAIGVQLATTTAGSLSATPLAIALTSTGVGTSGLTDTSLAAQTLTVTGQVYATAVAQLSGTAEAFGNVHVGASVAAKSVTLTNAATGALTDTLTGGASTATGSYAGTVSFSKTGLAAGASTQISLGMATGTAGNLAGGEIFSFVSHDGALADVTANSVTVDVTGAVYAYAAPTFSATTVNLGAQRVGGTGLTGGVTLHNGTTASAYQEGLVYGVGTAPTGFTVSGGAGTLASGGSVAIGVSLSAATSGDFTATLLPVALTSTGTGTSGLADTVLAAKTLTVNGAVYATATAELSAAQVSFGIVHVGDTVGTSLSLTNTASGALTDLLTSGTATGSFTGPVTLTLGAGLAAGASTNVGIGLSTGSSGAQSGNVVLGFTSQDTALADIAANSQTVDVTGTVDNYAAAAFELISGGTLTGSGGHFAINLGTLAQGGAGPSLVLGVKNSATGLADLLSGSFVVSGSSAFGNTGFSAITGLGAGQDEAAQSIILNTGTAGNFSETIVLSPTGSNASGYSGVLAAQTLTVTGVVANTSAQTYTLTAAPVSITGGTGDDQFVASGGVLNSRDSLNGGGGSNTLSLVGGGFFDLGAPKTFTNIQVVDASEGQAAGGGQPDTRQVLYLRDNTTETVNVAAGTETAGNTNPQTITIYGGSDSSTINLASGNDVMVLGGAKEIVVTHGGAALIQALASEAGALVKGTGTTTLEVTTGGTVSLNGKTATGATAADPFTVQLDQASVLKLDGVAFISAVGMASGNTITAGGAHQTLGGLAGGDTLIGANSDTDIFAGTAAGLNLDVLKNFGGTGSKADVIDLTNVAFATASKGYAAGTGQGELTVGDGVNSASLTMVGAFTLANFKLSTDHHGGTFVTHA